MRQKPYLGPRLRVLREARELTLEQCAAQLQLSPSYLSQLETNRRPVTATVLIALAKVFQIDAAEFAVEDLSRLLADLREACVDTPLGGKAPELAELRLAAATTPVFARQFLALHGAYRRLEDRVQALDDRLGVGNADQSASPLPYEEIRDFFHYRDNYLDDLDLAAEALAATLGIQADCGPAPRLESALRSLHDVTVVNVNPDADDAGLWWRFEPEPRVLQLAVDLPEPTRTFQLAITVARLSLKEAIDAVVRDAGFQSPGSAAVARVACENYAAGALMFPYREFMHTARALRHDVEQLQRRYRASFEQVCHRLSTLQRPGARGIPFYFVRVDQAGSITKRHSSTRFQFARFGGACPLWNVHESFAHPGRILVQVAEMPDAVRYLCMARSIIKRSGSFTSPNRYYAIGFGCEISHASEVVYADTLAVKAPPVPIGINCRLCERPNCQQRSFPPMDRTLSVPGNERHVLPYQFR